MAAGNGLGRALTRLNRADAEYLARVPQSLRGWLSLSADLISVTVPPIRANSAGMSRGDGWVANRIAVTTMLPR
jgi:hypothetical protein